MDEAGPWELRCKKLGGSEIRWETAKKKEKKNKQTKN